MNKWFKCCGKKRKVGAKQSIVVTQSCDNHENPVPIAIFQVKAKNPPQAETPPKPNGKIEGKVEKKVEDKVEDKGTKETEIMVVSKQPEKSDLQSGYDNPEIKKQYEAFHLGLDKVQLSSPSRRYSHPNQVRWLEEYEGRRNSIFLPRSLPPSPTLLSSLTVPF